jgi:hypothetical protein
MKKRFTLSLIVTSLLASSSLFANSYNDSVAKQEQQTVQSSKAAQAKSKVSKTVQRDKLLAKLKTDAFKKEATQAETKRLNTILNTTMQKHKKALKKAPKEFMSALSDTIIALQSLHANKIDNAKASLKKADAEFTATFKKEPQLGLIPVHDTAEVISFNGDAKLIKHIKASAIKLLKDNDTQLAIDMLTPLQDEMTITTQLVPTYLYPQAIKDAIKVLDKGDKIKASEILLGVLNTTQVDTLVVPIPFITAQDMVLEASKLKQKDKKEAIKLLNAAQEELQKAVLLGYAHNYQDDYKQIGKSIETLKTQIEGKNIVAKLYDDILSSFKTLDAKHKEDVKHSHK